MPQADYWATCTNCRGASVPGEVYHLLEVHYGGDPTCPHCLTEQADWEFHAVPASEDEEAKRDVQGVPAAPRD